MISYYYTHDHRGYIQAFVAEISFPLIHFVFYQLCLMPNLEIPHKHNTGTTMILFIYFLVFLKHSIYDTQYLLEFMQFINKAVNILDAPNPK
jgi:hypothetical protein